jgi:hypothetical protein
MVPLMDEAGEKRRFRKLASLERQRKLRLDDFVRASMGLPQGREFFYWLLEMCQVGRNPFTANALTTSFQCGEMNVGQQIQAHIIEVAPADFLRMLQEKQEEQSDDRTDSDDSGDSPY